MNKFVSLILNLLQNVSAGTFFLKKKKNWFFVIIQVQTAKLELFIIDNEFITKETKNDTVQNLRLGEQYILDKKHLNSHPLYEYAFNFTLNIF